MTQLQHNFNKLQPHIRGKIVFLLQSGLNWSTATRNSGLRFSKIVCGSLTCSQKVGTLCDPLEPVDQWIRWEETSFMSGGDHTYFKIWIIYILKWFKSLYKLYFDLIPCTVLSYYQSRFEHFCLFLKFEIASRGIWVKYVLVWCDMLLSNLWMSLNASYQYHVYLKVRF